MAEFKLDEKILLDILDDSIMIGNSILLQKAQEKIPRDKKRLPKPIILKKKSKPERNIRKGNKHYYRQPVQIAGNWYEGVTGNLARSLSTQKLGIGEYIVGIIAGPTEEYAKVQEFGSRDGAIPERSFLRKPLEENKVIITEQIQKSLNELLNNI